MAKSFVLLVSPNRARYFSLLAKEKYPKERRSRRLARYAGPLRFSCKPALAQLAALKQGASLSRFPLRCSAAPDGGGNSKPTPKTSRPFPFALTEYRSQSGIKARTLFERIEQREIASCARPRSGEERKESATADECTGVPFSLGTFSWALKRKYLAQMGET